MSSSLPSENVSIIPFTTHRALHILEIQDHIFSFNKVHDAVHCALVCKSWESAALDHVWHNLPSIRPLFNLLGPLASQDEDYKSAFSFTRKIRAADRARFSSIACRVKYLTINSIRDNPCESALIELLKSRMERSILPNLVSLTVFSQFESSLLQLAVPLLHPRLTLLDVTYYGGLDKQDAEIFLEEITFRSPNLRKCYMTLGFTGSLSGPLSRCLSSQKSLEMLCLPARSLTGSVLESVSSLPNLIQISLGRSTSDTGPGASETIFVGQRIGVSRFPALLYLHLQARLIGSASFISFHPNFTRLKELTINMIHHNDTEDFQKFLHVISETCKDLYSLELLRFEDEDDRSEEDPITKDVLIPLVSLRKLRKFAIEHPQPISLSDDELTHLLTRLPRLTKLLLNPNPLWAPTDDSPLPSLGVLHRISQCQPDLEHLSICFGVANFEAGDPLISAHSVRFENLNTLDIGESRIEDVDGTILCLSQILPPKCRLVYNGPEDALKLWNMVKGRIPRFAKAFSHYTQQSRALLEKVESLQMTLDTLSFERVAPNLSSQAQKDMPILIKDSDERSHDLPSKEKGNIEVATSE